MEEACRQPHQGAGLCDLYVSPQEQLAPMQLLCEHDFTLRRLQVGLVGRDGSAVLRRLDPVFDPAAIEREVAAICAQVRPCEPAILAAASCPELQAIGLPGSLAHGRPLTSLRGTLA